MDLSYIHILNDRFGTQVKPADQLFLDAINLKRMQSKTQACAKLLSRIHKKTSSMCFARRWKDFLLIAWSKTKTSPRAS